MMLSVQEREDDWGPVPEQDAGPYDDRKQRCRWANKAQRSKMQEKIKKAIAKVSKRKNRK